MLKREIYLKKIRPFYESDLIKVLFGMRRVGKSVILNEIISEIQDNTDVSNEQIIYVNFESLEYSNIKDEIDLYNYVKSKIVKNKKMYLFFDEVQNVKNFEKAINSFRVDFDSSIFITGSNGKLLSSDISTLLSGRFVQFKIMPFTYKEYVEYSKQKGKFQDKDLFEDYLKFGGMPQRFNFNSESETLIYLKDLYASIISRDIFQQFNIQNINLLNSILKHLLLNTSNIFSANSIVKFLKSEGRNVATETVYNYIDNILESLIINKVNRFDIKGKNVLSSLSKYYATDFSMIEINEADINLNLGARLENLVYNQLLAFDYEVYVGKTYNGEIDFVVKKGRKKKYIQVSYILDNEKTILREFNAFNPINDNFDKYVISTDKFDMSRNGIKHLNIIDFLMMDDF